MREESQLENRSTSPRRRSHEALRAAPKVERTVTRRGQAGEGGGKAVIGGGTKDLLVAILAFSDLISFPCVITKVSSSNNSVLTGATASGGTSSADATGMVWSCVFWCSNSWMAWLSSSTFTCGRRLVRNWLYQAQTGRINGSPVL